LQDDVIPAHLNFHTPNPHISWDAAPIEVPVQPTPWPRAERRVAGVSSFGFSGTNAHVILESAAHAPQAGATDVSIAAEADGAEVVTLSARSPEALRTLAARLADKLDAAE